MQWDEDNGPGMSSLRNRQMSRVPAKKEHKLALVSKISSSSGFSKHLSVTLERPRSGEH